MQCYHCPKRFFDRADFQAHRRSHSDRQNHLLTVILEDGPIPNEVEARRPRKAVFQASTFPSQWRTRPVGGSVDVISDISSFQDALMKFPARGARMSNVSEMSDVTCGDCDAVFSSTAELDKHYLTKFCPGAAIVVYVMTRDRFIKKGYRIEKRLIPLSGYPTRVPCSKCPEIFPSDEAKDAHESLHSSESLLCGQCGKVCDTLYEFKIHYDFHEDMEFRQRHSESASTESQGGFVQAKKRLPSGAKATATATELALKKLGKRSSQILRDSWPLKKYSQGEGRELLAISFSLPEDLEQVHAPDGVLQEVDPNTTVDLHVMQHTTWVDFNETDSISPKRFDIDDKSVVMPVDVDKMRALDGVSEESDRDVEKGLKRKPSIFRSVLSLKLKKRLSQSTSKFNPRRKLLKREHAIRFSFVTRSPRVDRAQSLTNSHNSIDKDKLFDGIMSPRKNSQRARIEAVDQNEEKDPYIHIRHSANGVVVEDATGRQRVLEMEQVASLVSIISNYFEASTLRSKVKALQSRATHNLRISHPKTAMSAYNDALETLYKNPVLDPNLTLRASILHRLGYVYYILGQTGESEACYLEALAIYRRAFGREHASNFTILNDLATLCGRDGYAAEAAELYERALDGRLRVLGPYAPETLSTMQELATLRMSLGNLESAVSLFEEVVPALDAVYGPKDERTLTAMNSLSVLYQKLGLTKQSLEVSKKMIPHCKATLGSNNSLTRAAVTRYVQDTKNFDFTAEIKKLLEEYGGSRNPENLRVLQALGRSYVDVGLNRDACSLFESLFEDLSALRGSDSPESFDALSGLCVAYENLGVLDNAIHSYQKIVQLAEKTPKEHPCRSRMEYAQKRLADLVHRREILTAERRDWNLQEEGPCSHCLKNTSSLCETCHIIRFCSDACRTKSYPDHRSACIPSITLRESKSVTITPNCPESIQKEALTGLLAEESGGSGFSPSITASRTVYMDPRNFTTFRLKLDSSVNTLFIFCAEADIQYTILGNISDPSDDSAIPPPIPRDRENKNSKGRERLKRKALTMSPSKKDNKKNRGVGGSGTCTTTSSPAIILDWITPVEQESVCINPTAQPDAPIYLVVAPGERMMRTIVEKRVEARGGGGDKERFEMLGIPNEELLEYSQGLLLNSYMEEAFLYIIEWT